MKTTTAARRRTAGVSPLEVCKAVRDRVGNKMAVEMRISADEIMPEGMRLEDTLAFLKQAQKYIDLVHVSKGLIVDKKYSFHTIPPYYHPYCHNVHYAEAAKQVLDIPVATVGLYQESGHGGRDPGWQQGRRGSHGPRPAHRPRYTLR